MSEVRKVLRRTRQYVDDIGTDEHGRTFQDISQYEVAEEERPGAPKKAKRPRRSRKVGTTYAMLDTRSLNDLELTMNEHRVLNCLIGHADPRNSETRISSTLIAERTGIALSNVSTNLTALRKRNVIFKIGPGHWMVNPWIAFMGQWDNWDKTAKEYPEPEWSRP